MATELYDLTVPVLVRGFRAMAGFLDKGRAFAEAEGMPPERLLQARLHDDMAPLVAQVQRASDTAKFAMVRLAEIDNVAMPDEEASFADLQARIDKTVALLEGVAPAAINGREEAAIELKTPSNAFTFTGRAYALGFVLPNFYFHSTTAYAILRHRGVPVGKMDFLGGL
jgi:uncharacterized protein